MHRIRSFLSGQDGQTTAEYAFVLIIVAVIVAVFQAFVKGGSLEELFQAVVRTLIERAT